MLTKVHLNLKKVRKRRQSIDFEQKSKLEEFYIANSKPSTKIIQEIADDLGFDCDTVRVWFCNRRQKSKRLNEKPPENITIKQSASSSSVPAVPSRSSTPSSNATSIPGNHDFASSSNLETKSSLHSPQMVNLSEKANKQFQNNQPEYSQILESNSNTIGNRHRQLESIPEDVHPEFSSPKLNPGDESKNVSSQYQHFNFFNMQKRP